MKIAIPSTGNTCDSLIDKRFGRCSYFAIYDSILKTINFVENTNQNSQEGAGPASVELIASQGVNKVISSEFGSKAQTIMNSINIEMEKTENTNFTILQIINNLKL